MSKKDILKLLKEEDLCKVHLDKLVNIVDKYYLTGDEFDFKEIIKKSIHCIPLNLFRYLMLFVANKETKMKIYNYAVEKGRTDLLSSIRGLTTKDFSLVSQSYNKNPHKKPEIEEFLAKQLSKAIKKEKEKNEKKNEKKYYAVQRYRSLKRKNFS